ncbi:condensin-2 complex subunit D3 isoform X1 [Anguilla rostrata]|uniref:condensin-2 complex subunit D3 isoform X1 n=1 Tax=Anguilla rostrata TaxID=7938 RepID=UPI0030D506BB
MELLNALELLKIKTVNGVWVDTVWDFEFYEAEPLDPVIEEEIIGNGLDAFKAVYKGLLPFATDAAGSTDNVWTTFAENGVSVNAVVAVLSHFFLGVKARTASLSRRLNALRAGSVYLLLLGIPGNIANKVFHPVLFDACLDLVKTCWPQDTGKKRKKDTFRSSQSDPKSKKRGKPNRKDNEAMEVDEFDDEDLEEEEMFFSAKDLLYIREGIICLVKTLLRLLTKLPLKDKSHSVQNCAQVFTDLTRFEPVIGVLTFAEGSDPDAMKSLPELAYHGLRLLCSPKHGEGSESVRQVFHRLLYVILMMSNEDCAKPSLLAATQANQASREQAIQFVSHIVDELKETALPILRILLQHICVQMVDKAEYRTSGAQTVVKLLAKMPCAEYASFIQWLYSYSLHSKVAYRMFALDVAMALVERPEREADASLSAELASFLPHKFLVQVMVFGRRSDRAPTVRSHALTYLGQCLELQSPNATESVQELFSFTSAQTILEGGRSVGLPTIQESNIQKTALNFKTIEMTNKADISTFDTKETMALLMRRVSDEKTNVRKSALQALMSLLKHRVIPCSQENLSILSGRCRDPAVSVKKKALQCLMDLLTAQPEDSVVQKSWLMGVVPAIWDSENSVQEKALECLDLTILANIRNHRDYSSQDIPQKLAWDLLGLLCRENQDLGRYLNKAFAVWSKQKKFSSSFVNSLISHTGAEHAPAAWLLLSKVAGSSPRLDYSRILDAWDETVRDSNVAVATSCHILCVIGDIAKHLNEDTKSRIVEDIMKWLKSFDVPLEVVSACVDALYQLGREEKVEDTQRFLNQHCGELVSICEAYLSGIMLSQDGALNLNEDLVVKHLFTLGVAALQCPARVGKRIFLLVQSILASNEELQLVDGSDELPATQPLSQFKPSSMPTLVRAHAFITLGKLCLQNEDLAKRCIPAFARELEVSEEVAVRNNVVVVMCDLCVRYTTMVDLYIPNISACLKDPEPLIREQTLILLTNLLQEEFVKWKGSLFFRFVSLLVDPEPRIASLCEFCLVHLLLKRNPIMFSQHFIECIFHFNCYEKHEKYNKFPQTDSEKAKFSLRGSENKERRMRIYRFLLKHFTDEQRFSITTKISQSVLACFVEDVLPLDSEGCELLSDTFEVLSLREIKLSAMHGSAERDELEEGDEMAMANAVIQVAQKKLISQVQKKNFIENVIPIIICLKARLEKKHFPVLKDLMGYLQVMMQSYRSEVKDFFAADEQLAAELEYDLQRFEKEQEMEQQLAACSVTDSTSASSPAVITTPRAATNSARASPVPTAGQSERSAQATPLPPGSAPRFITPRPTSAVKQRPMSTSEVLTRARKAVERSGLRGNRRASASSENATPLNPSAVPKHLLRLGSTGVGSALENRAISTPQRSMNELTFGEGVSAIFSTCRTEPKNAGKEDDNVLYMISPDKPTPPPRQWNVESPLCRRGSRRQRL